MYSGRMSLKDCITPKVQPKSDYVVIADDGSNGFILAQEGNSLSPIGEGLYRCRRKVAEFLGLDIICDSCQRMY